MHRFRQTLAAPLNYGRTRTHFVSISQVCVFGGINYPPYQNCYGQNKLTTKRIISFAPNLQCNNEKYPTEYITSLSSATKHDENELVDFIASNSDTIDWTKIHEHYKSKISALGFYLLGRMYYSGQGVQRNYRIAKIYNQLLRTLSQIHPDIMRLGRGSTQLCNPYVFIKIDFSNRKGTSTTNISTKKWQNSNQQSTLFHYHRLQSMMKMSLLKLHETTKTQ